MMGRLIQEPVSLPVLLAEAKALLRITTSEEDALLASWVRTAAETCEAFTRRMLIERECQETLAASTAWTRLTAAPVRSIGSVAALVDGVAAPLPAEAYAVDIDAGGDGWVRSTRPSDAKLISVTYRAGMAADWNGVPEGLRQGILRLAAHLHLHRDAAEIEAPPASVTALWRPWRRLRLG